MYDDNLIQEIGKDYYKIIQDENDINGLKSIAYNLLFCVMQEMKKNKDLHFILDDSLDVNQEMLESMGKIKEPELKLKNRLSGLFDN